MDVARCLADSGENDDFKALGLTADDLDNDLDVLEENLPAVHVFLALQTQWRHGTGGPTGLDYAVLPAVFGLLGIRRKRRPGVFVALRTMECEMLNAWSERRAARG